MCCLPRVRQQATGHALHERLTNSIGRAAPSPWRIPHVNNPPPPWAMEEEEGLIRGGPAKMPFLFRITRADTQGLKDTSQGLMVDLHCV